MDIFNHNLDALRACQGKCDVFFYVSLDTCIVYVVMACHLECWSQDQLTLVTFLPFNLCLSTPIWERVLGRVTIMLSLEFNLIGRLGGLNGILECYFIVKKPPKW